MKNPAQTTTSILLLLSSIEKISSFTVQHAAITTKSLLTTSTRQPNTQPCQYLTTTTTLHQQKKERPPAKGFGKPAKAQISVTNTYIDETDDDDTDCDTAVQNFFTVHQILHPLFRSILGTIALARTTSSDIEDYYLPPLPLAAGILDDGNDDDDDRPPVVLDEKFWEDPTSPWSPSPPAIPTGDNDKAVLGAFLDAMQKALTDIPVVEGQETDKNDVHFIEEGRRCIVITRFQVYGGGGDSSDGGVVDAVIEGEEAEKSTKMGDEDEKLSTAVWSEIARLVQDNERDSGSLIILPDRLEGVYDDMAGLREFTERNIAKPLDWLGLGDTFEVSSMQRGSLAIRLIHKLSDIPEPQKKEEEEEEEIEEEEKEEEV